MTLRCPNCGGKRLVFLSMTNGTAIGSTDQRYLCKDCGYRGSLVIDTPEHPPVKNANPAKRTKKRLDKERISKLFIIADVFLFIPVFFVFLIGQIPTTAGLVLLFSWIVVFFGTIMSFAAALSQGSDEWYHYGVMITGGILIGLVLGLLVGLDIYGIAIIIPFAVLGMLAVNWMFIDTSDDYIMKDLERLRKKID